MSTSDEMQQWLDEAKSDLQSVLRSYDMSTCIFSAPKELLKNNEDAYVPRIISIGPYHFGKKELREMERFKGEAVRREIVRIQSKPGNSDFCFNQVIDKIFSKIGEILRCYDKEIPYNGEVLCWMMARDACFILEFFRSYIWQIEEADSSCAEDGDFQFRERLHPIFGIISENHVVKSEIMRDFIKLENQIPLFVLKEVVAMEMGGSLERANSKLQMLLKAVFKKIYYRPFEYCAEGESPRQGHILDIYYHCCLGEEDNIVHRNLFGQEERQKSKFPSAVELNNGGVKIQANGEKVEDVSFEGRTLSIPPIKLDVDSAIFIRNLIELEICSPYGPLKRMTAFAQFMNELCQTERGAAVMREKGVFVGNLWQHSEVTQFFSSCNHSPLVREHYSIKIARRKLIKFYSRTCRISSAKVWKEFQKAYFSKPWVLIGGIGAIMVLLLTAIQVFCLFRSCGAR